MTIKKKRCISVCTILILSLLLTCIPFDSVFAVKGEVDPPALTTSFSSSDTFADRILQGSRQRYENDGQI